MTTSSSYLMLSAIAVGALVVTPTLSRPVQGQARVQDELVPMRDGTKLAVSTYFPTGTGPWPVVLTRTPYGKDVGDPARNEARYMANGYVRVLEDSRGKGKSEGVYRPFADDVEDGYDTIEWIARQSWSNGKVGMAGVSAMAIATYNAAMSGAPHFVAAFVTAGRGFTTPDGGVPMQHIEDWSRRQGVPPPNNPRPTFRTWGPIGPRDLRAFPDRITVPFYSVGGWYDVFEKGILDGYTFLRDHGAPSTRTSNRLMMAAFGHGPLSGSLKYPADGGDISMGDPIRWFDYWMKAIDNGVMKEPPVKYFVMGDTRDTSAPGNVWKASDTWPPPSTPTSYYLAPNHLLTTSRPSGSAASAFVYDPKDPVPTAGGNNLGIDRGPMDQRTVSSRADVLKFESAPLRQALEVIGPLKADLAVSTDAPDTDFMVKLVDVYPDGYEALVNDGAFRLRYVDGFDKQTRITPGKQYVIGVDLWATGLVFNAGHKIAVHVSSSNFPRFERHANTWEPLASYDDSRRATNTVWLDGRSRLVLPVTQTYASRPPTGGR
jgi:predicted acyl esterase